MGLGSPIPSSVGWMIGSSGEAEAGRGRGALLEPLGAGSGAQRGALVRSGGRRTPLPPLPALQQCHHCRPRLPAQTPD